MRVLIVDDDPDSVIPLTQVLDEEGHRYWETDFDGVETALGDYMPDLVVLDLRDEHVQPTVEGAGKTVYENLIWESHFCPVIVYSGYADQFIVDHKALVIAVSKGGGSEDLVREAIEELKPYSESIALLREIDQVARVTLRELMLAIANEHDLEDAQRKTLAVAMGRRRAAAYLDEQQSDAAHMPESQYIYPPSGRIYRFADVLRSTATPKGDPASYRLVLSPSCDMHSHGGGAPKVDRILVARCLPVPFGQRDLPGVPLNSKGADKLEHVLQEGSHNGLLFLPKFLGLVPAMCADFKNLEVLSPYELNANASCKVDGYDRVVSVDSPFRERIAWAFMNTAARPGIPQIDLDRWAAMYT